VVELDASGTEVRACGDEEETELAEGWKALRGVLRAAPSRLTRQEVRERWPADGPIPSPMTVWR
jgi:hypothetical protein